MKRNLLEKPILIVIAGPNGSGKTSFAEQVRSHHWYKDCVFINPDEIALTKFGDCNSPDSILKAAQHADSLRENYLQMQHSLAFETVFSSYQKGIIYKG
ncbi:MAG: zeta toxin family protein [Rhodobacteraceae bacterium]|nr:zeta toxin family protein [Paracoccaceae bacterium]MCY4251103.1 zeta toxin family protein [Paracoccaceae bacterium]MCY4309236.1 zeta toxin family protein [Paracoccaceae bacterium]